MSAGVVEGVIRNHGKSIVLVTKDEFHIYILKDIP